MRSADPVCGGSALLDLHLLATDDMSRGTVGGNDSATEDAGTTIRFLSDKVLNPLLKSSI